MIWPFRRSETRGQNDTYDGFAVAGLVAQASGSAAIASATGAVQACAGTWARMLSACTANVAAVGPALLANIGYDLAIRGESLHILDVDQGGRLRMLRAGYWTVYGGPDPASWRYVATLNGPTQTTTREYPAEAVAHVVYLPDARRPWWGSAPWQRAPVLASLASEVESALRDEARQPVQSIMAVPNGTKQETADNWIARLTDRRRSVSLPTTTAAGFGSGRAEAPQSDWNPRRLQPDPQPGIVQLAKLIPADIGQVYGIPAVLANGSGSETVTREAFRRMVRTTIGPLALLVSGVLTAALEQSVTLDLGPLRASDTAGIARSVGLLVKAGMSIDDALAQVEADS